MYMTDSLLCRQVELSRVTSVIMRLVWLSFCCPCWLVLDVPVFSLIYVVVLKLVGFEMEVVVTVWNYFRVVSIELSHVFS